MSRCNKTPVFLSSHGTTLSFIVHFVCSWHRNCVSCQEGTCCHAAFCDQAWHAKRCASLVLNVLMWMDLRLWFDCRVDLVLAKTGRILSCSGSTDTELNLDSRKALSLHHLAHRPGFNDITQLMQSPSIILARHFALCLPDDDALR